MLIFGERHLRRTLTANAAHCNMWRPLRALQLRPPRGWTGLAVHVNPRERGADIQPLPQRPDLDVPKPALIGRPDGLPVHLRCGAGLADLTGQRQWIVGDPHAIELLTRFRVAHDHRPTPVQIDSDELSAVILTLPPRVDLRSPSIRPGPPGAGGPAPSSHQTGPRVNCKAGIMANASTGPTRSRTGPPACRWASRRCDGSICRRAVGPDRKARRQSTNGRRRGTSTPVPWGHGVGARADHPSTP